ncbi:ATP-dependent protease La [Mycoplasmopsis maculosa]|uniref:endopeptidase La n=1 Tax=Mycoplasmopsis maculosa TaxID=114885 RepID=A0A449B3T1_9BACT|nr:endopeptidase La [Mycoplasmopsis maculosa]VEU75198.1 ATP-dependent protease La [Mycoplasmopsis maculosa]
MAKKEQNKEIVTNKVLFSNITFFENFQKETNMINDLSINGFVLFEGATTKIKLKPFGNFNKKWILSAKDKIDTNQAIKEQIFVIYGTAPEPTESQEENYDKYYKTLKLKNISSGISTLAEITKVEELNENEYVLTLRGLGKYELVSYSVDKNKEKDSEELTRLFDIDNFSFKKVNFDELLPGEDNENLEKLEKLIEKTIKTNTLNKIFIYYQFLSGYSTEEIANWGSKMSNHSSFINSDINFESVNPTTIFIKTILTIFPLTPLHAFDVFVRNNVKDLMRSYYAIFSSIINSFHTFIKYNKGQEEIKEDLKKIIKIIEETDFYKDQKSKFTEVELKLIESVSEKEMQNWIEESEYDFDSLKEFLKLASIATNQANKENDIVDDILFDNKSNLTENDIEKEINKKIKDNLDKQQREFLLREKMKAIKESLSENESDEEEDEEYIKTLKDPVLKNIYPESVVKLIKSENEKLKNMMSASPDANITSTYISQLKKLPWRKVEVESLDIKRARKVLEKNHYGLKEVKERIIEYLSLIINHKNINKEQKEKELINIEDNKQIDLSLFKENNKDKIQKTFNNVPILTLVGPPGTGKTSLARAIAEALNKSYVKISLGGVHDESEIRGHRKTYVGAMPGKIIKAIQRSGVSNPLILLDEIDKMASDIKGDPASAMLEVLDPEQNTKFQDNYIEHEYDLSKVLFIATANYYESIPAPLLDRVEIIELNSYTINEKIKIAKEHLVDAVIEQAGLNKDLFLINDESLEYIIKHYTAEAGVRGLKRALDKIARKIVTKIVDGQKFDKYEITIEEIKELLGTPKFTENEDDKKPAIGSVNGLAYTSIGGTTLSIEVSTFKSKNSGIRLTGSLKEVMQESAKIALSYVRSNADKFDIKDFEFDENEIHVHVPEGAVPKDGPSAGVTFTTALISALSKKPVSPEVAMTGEITLRGKVLEIGGLKEKSFAAYKKGVKKVFIPKANEKNLKDIPEEVKKQIKFIPVSSYDEIYEVLFKNTKKQ